MYNIRVYLNVFQVSQNHHNQLLTTFTRCMMFLTIQAIILLSLLLMSSALLQSSISIDNNMIKTYDDLATSLLSKNSQFPRTNEVAHQYWVGIAGPPGAGKSTLSSVCK